MEANMLALLHKQHSYYTTELAQTHQSLGKLYRKLAKTDQALAERKERELSRRDKKRLQWSRSTLKGTIQNVEAQQASLYGYLQQCKDLIASYEPSIYHLPQTPWTAHLPPSPYAFTPYSPIAPTPWTAGIQVDACSTRPQYWDLSMLRERRQSSPYPASADSGFYEPAMYAQPFGLNEDNASDDNHVFAHELMCASSAYSSAGKDNDNGEKNSFSEPDSVPTMLSPPTSPGAAGLTNGHKRRHSEQAIQLIKSRLAAAKTKKHHRGASDGLSFLRGSEGFVDQVQSAEAEVDSMEES